MSVEFVQSADRYLKWPALDGIERVLMVLCGVCLAGFTTSVLCDVVTREIGRPWLWLQEVTSAFFTYGTFVGAAVAVRRNDHLCLSAMADAISGPWRLVLEVFNRLVVGAVGMAMVVFGWQNFLSGFTSYRMPSLTPIASLYAAIPLAGVLIALFCVEQIENGLRHGFEGGDGMRADTGPIAAEYGAVL